MSEEEAKDLEAVPEDTGEERTGPKAGGLLAWFVRAGVAGVLLWLIFRQPELRTQVMALLRDGKWSWVGLGLVCSGLGIVCNILRWRLFLAIMDVRVGRRRLGSIFLVGSFFNLLLPGVIGGEAFTVIYLMRDNPGKRGRILMSIAADHLSGFFALLFAAAVFATARAEAFLSTPTTASVFIFMWIVVACGALTFLMTLIGTYLTAIGRVPKRIPFREKFIWLGEIWRIFLSDWRRSLLGCGISFCILLLHYTAFFCAGRAFGVPAGVRDVFSAMPAVDVATMVPVSLSGLGVREVLMKQILDVLAGVPAEQAVLLSLTGFGFTVIWSLSGAAILPFLKRGQTNHDGN